MRDLDPNWTAPRIGHDWRDDDVMLAVTWLKSLVPKAEMDRRLDVAKAKLLAARARMRDGVIVPEFDAADTAAWYVLQGETFATDRAFWTPEGLARAAPTLTRIGKELPRLLTVKGAEERAARLMLGEKSQPDSGLYELLVGLAYRRHGWTQVEFVPEQRGRSRTPDLHVTRPRSRWAAECKRLAPSPYAAREKVRGMQLAETIHALCLEAGESVVVEVDYHVELDDVPPEYLANHVRAAIKARSLTPWHDDIAQGWVRPVNWRLARGILAADDVYFGSSRMIEILSGRYIHEASHSMAAKWRPALKRPEYAEAVFQASVVTWVNQSPEAMMQKARHFRKVLANAEGQLPADRPGVIHVGIESTSGGAIDLARHMSNMFALRDFKPRGSRLRWVYGNYFVPEATTRKDETWAVTETMVPYRIRGHRTRWPLPGHMLISPEAEADEGVHWDRPDAG